MKHLYLPILFGLFIFTTDVNAAAAAPADETQQASTGAVPAAPAGPDAPATDTAATAGAGGAAAATPLVGGGIISDAASTVWAWTGGVAISGWNAVTGGIGNAASWVYEKSTGKHVHTEGNCPSAPDATATGGGGTATPSATPATA